MGDPIERGDHLDDKWFIFDLDGTIADIEDRRILAMNEYTGKMNWDVFFDPKNIKLDKPNTRVITMMQSFVEAGYKIAILSGRSKATSETTKLWLSKYRVPFNIIKMRPTGNKWKWMPDDKLKQSWLDDLFPGEYKYSKLIAVFDDRDKVVKMWRDNGLRCCQVAPGNF